jgi:hypothetical protein
VKKNENAERTRRGKEGHETTIAHTKTYNMRQLLVLKFLGYPSSLSGQQLYIHSSLLRIGDKLS